MHTWNAIVWQLAEIFAQIKPRASNNDIFIRRVRRHMI